MPDQCVKLTNGGLHTCADKGYVPGQRYEIFMSYNKPVKNSGGNKGVGVVVAETGPWNIDDNYWATAGDPTPRRLFADLPLGMPEAQAAFYNGYNGGMDQYGRKVTAPFGIDLAFEVADDLGLPPRANDWINVSFLWTEGWGSSGGEPGTSAIPAVISPVETASFKPDGSQVHTVRSGETLWAIAVAYGITLQRLRELNGLPEPPVGAKSTVILPGQEPVVRPAGPTPTVAPAQDPGTGGSETLPSRATPGDPSARRTEKAARKTATAAALTPVPIAGVSQAGQNTPGRPSPPLVPPGIDPEPGPGKTDLRSDFRPGDHGLLPRSSLGYSSWEWHYIPWVDG